MNNLYDRIDDRVEIIDITTSEDDPYDNWEIKPDKKFEEELLEDGYTYEDIYYIDMDREGGILVDYNLLPKEKLRWNPEKHIMTLKMKYPLFYDFKKALIDLGVMYDEDYWDTKHIED